MKRRASGTIGRRAQKVDFSKSVRVMLLKGKAVDEVLREPFLVTMQISSGMEHEEEQEIHLVKALDKKMMFTKSRRCDIPVPHMVPCPDIFGRIYEKTFTPPREPIARSEVWYQTNPELVYCADDLDKNWLEKQEFKIIQLQDLEDLITQLEAASRDDNSLTRIDVLNGFVLTNVTRVNDKSTCRKEIEEVEQYWSSRKQSQKMSLLYRLSIGKTGSDRKYDPYTVFRVRPQGVRTRKKAKDDSQSADNISTNQKWIETIMKSSDVYDSETTMSPSPATPSDIRHSSSFASKLTNSESVKRIEFESLLEEFATEPSQRVAIKPVATAGVVEAEEGELSAWSSPSQTTRTVRYGSHRRHLNMQRTRNLQRAQISSRLQHQRQQQQQHRLHGPLLSSSKNNNGSDVDLFFDVAQQEGDIGSILKKRHMIMEIVTCNSHADSVLAEVGESFKFEPKPGCRYEYDSEDEMNSTKYVFDQIPDEDMYYPTMLAAELVPTELGLVGPQNDDHDDDDDEGQTPLASSSTNHRAIFLGFLRRRIDESGKVVIDKAPASFFNRINMTKKNLSLKTVTIRAKQAEIKTPKMSSVKSVISSTRLCYVDGSFEGSHKMRNNGRTCLDNEGIRILSKD